MISLFWVINLQTDLSLILFANNKNGPEPLTNILTKISGKTCHLVSRVGEIEPLEKAAKTALNAASRLEFPNFGDSGKMVEVAGVEPASREVSNMASTRLAVLF